MVMILILDKHLHLEKIYLMIKTKIFLKMKYINRIVQGCYMLMKINYKLTKKIWYKILKMFLIKIKILNLILVLLLLIIKPGMVIKKLN